MKLILSKLKIEWINNVKIAALEDIENTKITLPTM